ncbi:MAG: flagellar hook-basal body protein [Limnochordaceae bacterium]|nr:flagellar hook-basal body protein [Limnochordaceae bacterium]
MRGLYTAASGMLVQQLEMDRISNDLANSSTVGYRGQQSVYQGFPAVLLQQVSGTAKPWLTTAGAGELAASRPRPVGGLEQGAALAGQFLDVTPGAIRQTDNPLDVALSDDSFLQVQGGPGQGILLTRAGELHLDGQGRLVTAGGQPVLVELPGGGTGPITLTATPQIDEDGVLWVAGQTVGRLARVRVAAGQNLQPVGQGPYLQPTAASGAPTPVPAGSGGVQPGALEMANVEPVMSMVEMIAANRAYEASARLITTYDDTYAKLINAVMA